MTGRSRSQRADTVTLTIDGVEVDRAQGRAGDPGRRADGHRDPAVLRPPAARAGRRLPAVPGRGRGPAQAGRLLHPDGRRRHGRQDPAHLAGGREGAGGRHGAAADQPPARLPDVRQGRRVPAAEPGDVAPAGPTPGSTSRSASSPSRSPSPSQVLLDRERCVLCQRCTRFSEEIAGDKFIDLMERSSAEQIGVYRDDVFGGDDTGDGRRRRRRRRRAVQLLLLRQHHPDLPGRRADRRAVPVPGPPVRPGLHAQRLRALRGRLRAAHRPPARQGACAGWPATTRQVNEEWNCDKGRWGFQYATAFDRLTHPLVRDAATGELREASLARGAARSPPRACGARDRAGGVGVLTGGRLTVEDAYAYAKFARVALRHQRHRLPGPAGLGARRPSSSAANVVGRRRRDLRRRGDRDRRWCSSAWSRRRSARSSSCGCARQVEHRRLPVHAVAPFAARGLREARRDRRRRPCPATRPRCWPTDAAVAAALAHRAAAADRRRAAGHRRRVALSAAAALADATGAKLAWVPRRAGDRGAVDAGCLPNLLPGGRPVADAAARAELAAAWDLAAGVLPERAGPGHRRDRRGGRGRRARRAGRRRRRPGRPGRPAAGRARRWTRWTSWSASRCGRRAVTRAGRRGVPGRAGGREGRHLRGLGGPGCARSRRCCSTTAMTDARVLDALAARDGRRARLRRRRRRSAASSAALPATEAPRPAAPTVAARSPARRPAPARRSWPPGTS